MANRDQLPEFFAILFSYRERIDQVLSFSSGVMEASGLYLQAHREAAKLNRLIEDNISIIDDILAALISPETLNSQSNSWLATTDTQTSTLAT